MGYQDIVTVAVVNFRPFWGRKDRNLSRIVEYSKKAAAQGTDIILFPELALTGFENEKNVPWEEKMQVREAELIDGPSVTVVSKAAVENQIIIVFGMPELDLTDGKKVYNTAVVCGKDGSVQSYRKIHPANDESEWCNKGDSPLLLETEWGPVGVGVCYDTYSFPELLRYYACKGARLYLNITAMLCEGVLGFDWKSNYYDTLRYAVIANDIFVASSNIAGIDVIREDFCNAVGNETVKSPMLFAGASVIMGPGTFNKVHVYAGGLENREAGLFISTLDLSGASRMIYGKNPYTGVPDYRPDIYKKLCEDLISSQQEKNSKNYCANCLD